MRAPPAFSVLARPGLGWRLFVAAVHGLAVAATAAWATAWLLSGLADAADPDRDALSLGLATFASGGLAALWGWRRSAAPPARLSWTGSRWTLSTPGAEPADLARVQVRIDLDRWMLLRAVPAPGSGRVVWLNIAAADAGPAWPLLRAALYSSIPSSMTGPREDRPPF